MVWGLGLVLAFMALEMVMGVRQATLATPMTVDQARAFAGAFRAESHAALAYATANQSATGGIAPSALAPYIAPWSLIPSAQAQITNGLLIVSATPPGPPGTAQWVARNLWETQGDMAYGSVINGQMVSAQGASLGTAPAGVSNGSAVYVVSRPIS